MVLFCLDYGVLGKHFNIKLSSLVDLILTSIYIITVGVILKIFILEFFGVKCF